MSDVRVTYTYLQCLRRRTINREIGNRNRLKATRGLFTSRIIEDFHAHCIIILEIIVQSMNYRYAGTWLF